MANDLTGHPWIIDTVAASTDIVTNAVKIAQIVIDGTSIANTDAFQLTNSANKVIFSVVANTATLGPLTYTFPYPEGGLLTAGLRCSALTHGKMYVYVTKDSRTT